MSPIFKICAEQGCWARTTATRCTEHAKDERRRHNNVPERRAHHTRAYKRLRKQVLSDAGYICHWCGYRASECDFVVPLAKGGEMTYANATASCKGCNSRRGGSVRR